MAHAPELVFDLIFGRWRSQTLYAGAALGVFDQLSDQPPTAATMSAGTCSLRCRRPMPTS